jgi:hypothetical protein
MFVKTDCVWSEFHWSFDMFVKTDNVRSEFHWSFGFVCQNCRYVDSVE